MNVHNESSLSATTQWWCHQSIKPTSQMFVVLFWTNLVHATVQAFCSSPGQSQVRRRREWETLAVQRREARSPNKSFCQDVGQQWRSIYSLSNTASIVTLNDFHLAWMHFSLCGDRALQLWQPQQTSPVQAWTLSASTGRVCSILTPSGLFVMSVFAFE